MDICYINEEGLKCIPRFKQSQINKEGRTWLLFASANVNMVPNTSNSLETQVAEKVVRKLEASLVRHMNSGGSRRTQKYNEKIGWTPVRILIGHCTNRNKVEIFIINCLSDEKSHLSCLQSVLGKGNLTFDCKVVFGTVDYYDEFGQNGISIRNFNAHSVTDGLPAIGFGFTIQISAQQIQLWSVNPKKLQISLSVTLKMNDKATNVVLMDNMMSENFCNKTNMMNDTLSMDVKIVVAGAAQVQCHSKILSDVSPVLKAMLEHAMVEGNTKTIEITEMTEAGVRALLDFLYSFDVTEILKCCETAYQLLEAAVTYDITMLRESVAEIILLKKLDWFLPNVIINILLLARRKIGEGEDTFYKQLENKTLTLYHMDPNGMSEFLKKLVSKETLS